MVSLQRLLLTAMITIRCNMLLEGVLLLIKLFAVAIIVSAVCTVAILALEKAVKRP